MTWNSGIEEIKSQGYDEETASYYASRLGDTPICDEAGNFLVKDEAGKIIAILKPLNFFGDLK